MTFASVICALGSSGCAEISPILNPRQIPKGASGLFGHIAVFNKGEDVTEKCGFALTDDQENRKGGGKTGWVFIVAEPGPTYFSHFSCGLTDGLTTYVARYETRNLMLDLPGGDNLAYFGHIQVEMASLGKGVTAATFLFGGIGNLIASSREGENGAAGVVNHFDKAKHEYQVRYGQQASGLKPIVVIAGRPMVLAVVPSSEKAAGFVLGKDAATAEASCTGAGLAWQKLADGRFSCSSTPLDLRVGVPVTVTLTSCAGTVCEVALNASSDGAGWPKLRQRFDKLTRLLEGNHGTQRQSVTTWLDCTADGVERCRDMGRVRMSDMWRWPNGQGVSLVLDGGPLRGAPTLSLVYSTAALSEVGEMQPAGAQPASSAPSSASPAFQPADP